MIHLLVLPFRHHDMHNIDMALARLALKPTFWRAYSSHRPYEPWQFASARNAAKFFVYFVGVRFSCGG
jgi:hypothetical protein